MELINNKVIIGEAASGKTTYLIKQLQELVANNPDINIGLYENYQEIEPNVANIHFTKEPAADMSLFVCALDTFAGWSDIYQNAIDIIKSAMDKNIPVWIEVHKARFDLSDIKLDNFEIVEITRNLLSQ